MCRLLPCQPGQVVPEALLSSWIRQRSSGRLLYQTVLADCKRLRLLNPLEKWVRITLMALAVAVNEVAIDLTMTPKNTC